ncbi:MAG: methyltransferase [Oscillospiraceae bacterium]|nr:methyltransferase [Oscillospiraceae bacterium]
MEYLQNGYALEIPEGCFPLSTDSVALSAFAKLPRNARVLDLGAGCGTLGMLLCASYPDCSVVGIEINETAHNAALVNAQRNGICHRYSSICTDMSGIEKTVKAGSFHICISNPPYFSGGPASALHGPARQEQTCTPDTLFRAAAWALQWGGDFFLVHRPERLAELCGFAAKYSLEPKVLQLLRHRKDGPVSLILLQCRKGAKPGLIWQEQHLYEADGKASAYYHSLYH